MQITFYHITRNVAGQKSRLLQ